MIKLARSLGILLIFFIATPTASGVDIPFLTWENGKQQAIVLGGPSSSTDWQMALVGENTKPLIFKASVRNSQGFYVFSIDLPKDLAAGAYRIETTGKDGVVSVVAGVQVKERENYTITEIPLDLRLLAIIFSVLTALYTVVRSQKYSRLEFRREIKSKSTTFFYRFRNKRLASHGDSFLRYLALRDGEPLHKVSGLLWSVLPWLAFPLGVYTAVAIQFDAAIPNGPTYLFFICAIIGAIDAAAGIALAFGLGLTHVALGNVTSLRTLLIAGAFSLAWYLPALIGSMVNLTAEKDLVKNLDKRSFVAVIFTSVLAGILGSFAVVISVILTDSLVINRQSDPALRWPLAIVVGLVITLKYLLEHFLQTKQEEDAMNLEKLYLARVVSPGMAMTLLGSLFAIVFIWTQSYLSAAGAALVIATPYFLLFLVFPRIAITRLENGKRNMLVEAVLVGFLTFTVYTGISFLPTTVIAKSQAFILLGLIPGLLHGIYSVIVASSERVARKAEEAIA